MKNFLEIIRVLCFKSKENAKSINENKMIIKIIFLILSERISNKNAIFN